MSDDATIHPVSDDATIHLLASELAVTSALLQETYARLNWLESTVAQALGMATEPPPSDQQEEEALLL